MSGELINDGEKLAQVVAKFAPGGKLLHHRPLTGGISAQTHALEVELADGEVQRWVVRRPSTKLLARRPDLARCEYRVLAITRELGLATPAPYALDETGTIFSGPYLILEYIDGAPDYAPRNRIDYAAQCAAQLAKLHRIDHAHRDLSFVPRLSSEIPQTPPSFWADLDSMLPIARAWETLTAAWPLVPRHPATLLHGDFWPGNLLWRGGTLVGVIDWEDAQVGDPLYDLAVCRLDLLCILGEEALESLTRHYRAANPLDFAHLPYWDLMVALRLVRMAQGDFVEWAAFFPPLGREEITAASLLAHLRGFMTQALDQIDG